MKKQFLIFISAAVFTVLFYNEEIGVNLSFFAILLLLAQLVMVPALIRDKRALLLASCVLLSSVSHAWLLSFASFVSVIVSSFVFRYYVTDPKLRLVTQALVYFTNWPAFIVQVFQIESWFEFDKNGSKQTFTKIFSYFLIPLLILSVFSAVYVSSSEWLSGWYNRYEWDFDILMILVFVFGFYVSFVFWRSNVYNIFTVLDRKLLMNFSKQQQGNIKPTIEGIPLEFELRSGIITLVCLDVMLLFFIIVFNLENASQSILHISEYSDRTHDQIYLIIGSIFMAMLVILFFFKDALNFIKNNGKLLLFAKIWLVLNGILIVSAFYQNTLYVQELGLTYKRLGVYLFLILCAIGLCYSYLKIQLKRKNFYLVDRMSWVVYFTLILCPLVNWSSIITAYNLKQKEVDLYYLEHQLNGNERVLLKYYKQRNLTVPEEIEKRIAYYKNLPFLSSQFYYKSMEQ